MESMLVVPPGEYYSGGLTEEGRAQSRRLGDKLRPFGEKGKSRILTAPALCTRQRAGILSHIFGADPELHRMLWPDVDHPQNLAEVLDLVRSRMEDVNVLVVVTSDVYVANFPAYFGEHVLGRWTFPRFKVKPDQVWHVDCKEKAMRCIG